MKIQVFMVDDHLMFRTSLQSFLIAQSDIDVVGDAADGTEAARRVREVQPNVVLLDLGLPNRSGLSALPDIFRACPNTNVLALTMYDDVAYVRSFFLQGGAGYLLKSSGGAELLTAIRAVAQGRFFIDSSFPESVVQRVWELRHKKGRKKNPGGKIKRLLSEREQSVLSLVARGYSNREIAKQLRLSVKSVETYRMRVMHKLELKSRAALVRYALEMGMLFPGKPSALLD